MGLVGVISNLLSSFGKLLPAVSGFTQAPSSSSSPPVEDHQIEFELKALMKMLERIKATLYDAEGRDIMDLSVKLWLKELKEVAYNAEDVLDDYKYEVLRAQVEARDSRKRKLIQMPDRMFDEIKCIKVKFEEIEKHHIALRLSDDDGPRRCNNELQIAPRSHFVMDSDIFGRDMEKEKLIDILCSHCPDGNVVHVVTIVGTGGLGKTTLAQLAYNDQRIKQRFDEFGWICVSEDFDVQRLTREAIESITRSTCGLSSLIALQEKIIEEIRGKSVILILDDVWNENRIQWEVFRGPFMSAKEAKILVTTRNKSVAIIMQTFPTFKLDYMSREQSWQLFKHYAFGDVNQNEASKFVEVGKKILKKCGNLPLAIKSIASVLRHEVEEESWIDILESEIWNFDKLCNNIFTPLQLSYTHLPTYLKPCFLYCSIFPKGCSFTVEALVSLWISQGYIESNGKRSAKKIGEEYAKQLWHRSFFEVNYMKTEFQKSRFKLHDMVHDLARLNSGNECFSIVSGKSSYFPEKLYHLYIGGNTDLLKPCPSVNFTDLRTLIIDSKCARGDFSQADKLRALNVESSFVLVGNLNHLRYLALRDLLLPESLFSLYFLKILSLMGCDMKELPKSIGNLVSLEELTIEDCKSLEVLPTEIGSLKNLQALTLRMCYSIKLPESIGNLVSLVELTIDYCKSLEEFPTEMGNLTNLRTLKISNTGVNSLPPSLNKLITNIQTLDVRLKCQKIGWLKDFVNLKGILAIENFRRIASVVDSQRANLVRMHNLECLMLFWEYNRTPKTGKNQLQLSLIGIENPSLNDNDHILLISGLQPHPNLRELHISHYPGTVFPEWIGNPISCASLEQIVIENCINLKSISFGSLFKLKYIGIKWRNSLQFLGADSLPLQLQELEIVGCMKLKSLPEIKNLTSLVKLSISWCTNLHSLMMDTEPSVEPTPCMNGSLHQNSLLGLRNLISLRSLKIVGCKQLEALVDEPRPVKSCEVEIESSPGLKQWCWHHNIPYKVLFAISYILVK